MSLFSKRVLLSGVFGLAGLSFAAVAPAQQPYGPSAADCPNGICPVPTSQAHYGHTHRPGEYCDANCEEHQHAFGHCDENCDSHHHDRMPTTYQHVSASSNTYGTYSGGTMPSASRSANTWHSQPRHQDFGAAPNPYARTNTHFANPATTGNRQLGTYQNLSHQRPMGTTYPQYQQHQTRSWQSSNSVW